VIRALVPIRRNRKQKDNRKRFFEEMEINLFCLFSEIK
jgi:hypothetical protein